MTCNHENSYYDERGLVCVRPEAGGCGERLSMVSARIMRRQATALRAQTAAKAAGAHSFVRGFETLVRKGGQQ